jgi:uncharacterized protein YecE (DUF72 family)
MTLRAGTMGYSHDDWKGSFYPEVISQKKMLGFYGQRLTAVEVNYTFRKMPTRTVVANWARHVPTSFQFLLKALQAITHVKRLQNAEQEADDFLNAASALRERRGPILFQLPPSFAKDIPRLDAFLKHVAGRAKVAFEFRHPSWFGDELTDCLRAHSAVLCCTDGGDLPAPDLIPTTDWCYVRLHDDDYSEDQLRNFLTRIRWHNWDDVYVMGNCFRDPNILATLYKGIADLEKQQGN